eukprot:46390-Chlamydomonas_euryale.AAC.1
MCGQTEVELRRATNATWSFRIARGAAGVISVREVLVVWWCFSGTVLCDEVGGTVLCDEVGGTVLCDEVGGTVLCDEVEPSVGAGAGHLDA